jgi:hypothetical protein
VSLGRGDYLEQLVIRFQFDVLLDAADVFELYDFAVHAVVNQFLYSDAHNLERTAWYFNLGEDILDRLEVVIAEHVLD